MPVFKEDCLLEPNDLVFSQTLADHAQGKGPDAVPSILLNSPKVRKGDDKTL